MRINCPICSANGHHQFNAQVLGKYQASYYLCMDCEYLWVDSPNWLEEAYSNAIADSDTGLVMRNLELSRKLSSLIYFEFGERGAGKYVDAAGGYGLLTRLMRDRGFEFYWQDKYCPNILARGFEYSQGQEGCESVTAFEVLEHLVDPLSFINDSLKTTGAKSFIFSTELYEGSPPEPKDWWYYSLATGQHIGFFTRKTLETLAKKLGLTYLSSNGLHIFSQKPINPIKVNIITNKYLTYFAACWAKYSLKSKTLTDSEFILRNE